MQVNPKEEGFDYLYTLVTKYAAYKNAHLHFDLKEIPKVELETEIKALYNLIQEVLEVGEL